MSLPERAGDEIGALTRSFNTMAVQLKERIHLRQSLDLAKEVQQNLLPAKAPEFSGLDVAGRSVYCDQTGGDYFDYLNAGQSLRSWSWRCGRARHFSGAAHEFGPSQPCASAMTAMTISAP